MSIYPYQELTQNIIGAAFEVHNTLGHGFLEKVYHNALTRELKLRGHEVETNVRIPVTYKNEVVGDYIADIVVNKCVILELKALNNLTSDHEAQLLNYLKGSGHKIGLLLNFGTGRVQIKRKIL